MQGPGRPPDPRTLPPPDIVADARWIPLTRGRFALVDAEDYKRISMHVWSYIRATGSDYAKREEETAGVRTVIFMEKEVLGVLGRKVTVDHKNGNGLDNRKFNLRICTRSQNQQNKKKPISNTSGFKGVAWSKAANKWCAYIAVNKERIHLGLFVDPKEAARAYDTAARKFFGEFARPNFS